MTKCLANVLSNWKYVFTFMTNAFQCSNLFMLQIVLRRIVTHVHYYIDLNFIGCYLETIDG